MCPQVVAARLPPYLETGSVLRLTAASRPLSRLKLPLDLGTHAPLPLAQALQIDASLARPGSIPYWF